MDDWQKIDENHAHCSRCADAFRTVELEQGLCKACCTVEKEKSAKVLSRASGRTMSKATMAASQFLASMKAQGKEGKSMPRVFNSFWNAIGGEDGFGERMGEEFKKVHGEGLSADELEAWRPSQKMKLQWYELISRHASKNDESMSLDIGSLEESDLESLLAGIARRVVLDDHSIRRLALMNAITEDPEFRKAVVFESLKADPDLLTLILSENGIETLEGQVAQNNSEAPDNNTEEEDDYDPSSEEYNDD